MNFKILIYYIYCYIFLKNSQLTYKKYYNLIETSANLTNDEYLVKYRDYIKEYNYIDYDLPSNFSIDNILIKIKEHILNKNNTNILDNKPENVDKLTMNNETENNIELEFKQNKEKILLETKTKINKLKTLANFFNNNIIFEIVDNLDTIESLFKTNNDIDINKLELFNLQITDSIISLLLEIKKKKEVSINLLNSKIDIIRDKIIDTQNSYDDISNIKNIESLLNPKVKSLLQHIYNCFSNSLIDNCLDNHTLINFYKQYQQYFKEIDADIYKKINNIDNLNYYNNNYICFEKKLLGILNIELFNVEYINTLRCGNYIFSIFKIPTKNKYFIFNYNKKLFKFVDYIDISTIINLKPETNSDKQSRYLTEIENLNLEISDMKNKISPEITKTLNETLIKMKTIDFLSNNNNIDIQTNVLKEMIKNDLI